jgi:hypothetical protein
MIPKLQAKVGSAMVTIQNLTETPYTIEPQQHQFHFIPISNDYEI